MSGKSIGIVLLLSGIPLLLFASVIRQLIFALIFAHALVAEMFPAFLNPSTTIRVRDITIRAHIFSGLSAALYALMDSHPSPPRSVIRQYRKQQAGGLVISTEFISQAIRAIGAESSSSDLERSTSEASEPNT